MNDKTLQPAELLQRVLALTSSGEHELRQPRAGLSLPQRWLLAQLDGEATLVDLARRPGSPAVQRLPRDAAKLVGLGLACDVGEGGPTPSDFGPASDFEMSSTFGPTSVFAPTQSPPATGAASPALSSIERAHAVASSASDTPPASAQAQGLAAPAAPADLAPLQPRRASLRTHPRGLPWARRRATTRRSRVDGDGRCGRRWRLQPWPPQPSCSGRAPRHRWGWPRRRRLALRRRLARQLRP